MEISCVVTGNPEPTVTWMYEEEPLIEDGLNYFITKDGEISSLTIQNTSVYDTGTYVCEANNAHGTDSQATYLQVKRKLYVCLLFCFFLPVV